MIYYDKAYHSSYTALASAWKNNGVRDTSELAFYTMLDCFYFNSINDYNHRARVLADYLRSGGEYRSDIDSLLSKHTYKLPKDSIVSDLLSQITTVYDQPATRSFSDKQANQEAFSQVYNDIDLDSKMQKIHEIAKLQSTVAVRYFYDKSANKSTIEYYTPSQFVIEADGMNLTSITLEKFKSNGDIYFEKWTKDHLIITDGGGKVVGEPKENIYKRIPYSLCYLGNGQTFSDGGMLDLVEAQLQINKVQFQINHNITYMSSPVRLVSDIPKDLAKNISPDSMIVTQTDTMRNVSGNIKFITPPNVYKDLQDFRDIQILNLKERLNIPLFADGEESGVARKLRMKPLLEARQKDINQLLRFEKDLFDLIQHVLIAEKWGHNSQTVDNSEFKITYKEVLFEMELSEQFEYDTDRMNKGLLSQLNYFKLYGDTDVSTQQDYDILMKDRIIENDNNDNSGENE